MYIYIYSIYVCQYVCISYTHIYIPVVPHGLFASHIDAYLSTDSADNAGSLVQSISRSVECNSPLISLPYAQHIRIFIYYKLHPGEYKRFFWAHKTLGFVTKLSYSRASLGSK